MRPASIRPTIPTVLIVSLLACAGSDGEATTTSSETTGTDAGGQETSGAATSTTTGAASTSTSSGTEATGDAGDASDTGAATDTGDPGAACPLQDDPTLVSRSYPAELWSAGDVPTSCFPNPERGFHRFTDLSGLDAGTFEQVRSDGFTLATLKVLIPEYRDVPLSDGLLEELENAFGWAQDAGVKLVPRVHYSDAIGEDDASLERILGHVDQLAPVFQRQAPVLAALQAGFIGAWGEWHASTHGLDAPEPRKAILDALLAALPPSRMVEVRRPSFKQDAYGGPLTDADAWAGSSLARVGHANDCFLASEDDAGTWQLPGEKDYHLQEGRFLVVGGETCAVSSRSTCDTARSELADLHFSHLNHDYHPEVLQGFRDAGCWDEIACRLGYRFALLDVRHAASASPGGSFGIELTVVNDGWAAPYNLRPVFLVLQGPVSRTLDLGLDARTWQPGEDHRCFEVEIPTDLPAGTYGLRLALPDPDVSLAADARFSIRFANLAWDDAGGTMDLGTTLTVG